MLEKFYITCEQENHWTLDIARADYKIIYLRDEYEKFWQKIKRGENFALSRYGDGERSLMLGHPVHAQEGWQSSGQTALGTALLDSLNIDAPNYYYAISCPCCDSAAYYWYLRRLKTSNLTFSNIWIGANFKMFQKDFAQLKRNAVLITNWRGKGKKYGRLNIKYHYTIDDQCVPFWEAEGEKLINQIIAETGHEKNLLYVVSAGPMSCVIIAALFKNNPDNCYIDFGSATDLMTHEKVTRPYMIDGNPYAEQSCWMFDRKKISVDVDVVLTCYKRPQVLAQQLAAVKNQTLAPRRIFLYQDGINGYYKVELNDRILGEFDACKISATNGGVWKRFEFAEDVCKSPYVCMFDDDTIPGNRWLENCHMNMMQQRGIYGTNGVLMTAPENYPKELFNVGWHRPNSKTCAVDFVGHAWFFEREALEWMLAKPWHGKYKLVAEDMTLSFAASEQGVGTYVPQHSAQIPSLWGSLPDDGWKYGTDEAAVSVNPANLATMKEAVAEIRASGWKTLLEQNPDYFAEISSITGSSTMPADKNTYLQNIKGSVKNLLPFFGKKIPLFFCTRNYASSVQNLFNLQAEDCYVLEDENNHISMTRLFKQFRPGAIHIFFTEIYEQLKPLLEQRALREGVDFADGRGLLIANMG